MYYRSQGYPYQKNMNIPPNYGGNAFSEDLSAQPKEDSITEFSAPPQEDACEKQGGEIQLATPEAQEATHTSAGNFRLGSLLGGKIGAEELLLLAVIFLLADSEGSDDILWLLILLLFIK